jgi:hypothetical protein
MRDLLGAGRGWTLALGAALLVAGCGGGEDATNAAEANALDANLMLELPINDASAMESAANATDPVFTNAGEDGNAADMVGETEGGDTGGNSADRNASAM